MILVPANDAPGVSDELRDSADRLRDRLAQIEERWNNRLSLEKCSFAEEYIKGRINIALYFRLGNFGSEDGNGSDSIVDTDDRVLNTYYAIFIGNLFEKNTSDPKDDGNELVLANSVKLGNGPQRTSSAFIGLQLGHNILAQPGASLIYRSYISAGYKLFRQFVKREINVHATGANNGESSVIECASQAMNRVTNMERHDGGQTQRPDLYAIARRIRITLYDEGMQIDRMQPLQDGLELLDVCIGPLNL